jgi:hypothetical protein
LVLGRRRQPAAVDRAATRAGADGKGGIRAWAIGIFASNHIEVNESNVQQAPK